MSPGELGLVLGVGLVGLFSTLVLIAVVAAPLVAGRDAREHERLERVARMKAAERRPLTCLPDPQPVVDLGVAGEAERYLAQLDRSRR